MRTGRIVDMFLAAILRTGTKNDYLFRFLVPYRVRSIDIEEKNRTSLKPAGNSRFCEWKNIAFWIFISRRQLTESRDWSFLPDPKGRGILPTKR